MNLTLKSQPNAIVVPTAALQTSQNGTYVYVIDQDMTAKQQPVKVGWNVGEDTVIASGLQPGQRIVTDGQLRLTPGAKSTSRAVRKLQVIHMNTQLFIRRPITTTLIMAAILIFGIFAYRLLPVSDLPNVDFPPSR